MNIKLDCPVCGYQEITGNICPNCDADLVVLRMLQELPQVQTQLLKLTVWPFRILLFIFLVGIGLGVGIGLTFLQPLSHTLIVSYSKIDVGEVFKIPNCQGGI